MTIIIELKPEIEARLRTEAELAGQNVEELAAAWIAERCIASQPSPRPRAMTPKEAIAYWEREGLLPAFEDGPDSPELVLQWRKQEENGGA